MKISKRDFLKAIGVSASSLSVAAKSSADAKTKAENITIAPPSIVSAGPNDFRIGGQPGFYSAANWTFYDRVQFPARMRLFDRHLFYRADVDRWDGSTNMWHLSHMGFPAPTSFLLRRIHILAVGETLSRKDAQLLGQYVWELKLLDKIFAAGALKYDAQPVSHRPALLDVARGPVIRDSLDIEQTTGGGLWFASQMPWSLEIRLPAAADTSPVDHDAEVHFLMEGIHLRGVQ